jgi:signal transduction histidine kinase
VGQLAAGLAHELNNPLTVILGAAQEAGREGGSGRRAWLRQVVREVKRCKRLIDELLDFSRPIRLQAAPTPLAPLCREAWAHAALGRRSKARLSLPDKDLTVSVDASRLKQVLVNLFGNALDAMGSKGAVELRWQRQGARLRLQLQDNGPGIGKKDPEALFRPFYTAKVGGTGLGLPISRAILQAHGGGLWVEPHNGKGLRLMAELKTSKLKGAR